MVEEKVGAREKPGLKPAQVAASALAAVTAAFLGSTLGVAGTVAGAGIASVVTTVGGEVYLRSLRRTREATRKTKEVLALTDTRLRQETRHVEPPPTRPVNPLFRREDPTVRLPRPTQVMRSAGHGGSGVGERTVLIPRPDVTPPKPGRPWWKNRWTLAAGTTVVAFLVGMLAITGFETVTGHTVSGGSGTTVGRVGGTRSNSPAPTVPTTTVTQTRQHTRSEAPATRTTEPMSATTTPASDSATRGSAPSSVSATPTERASPTGG